MSLNDIVASEGVAYVSENKAPNITNSIVSGVNKTALKHAPHLTDEALIRVYVLSVLGIISLVGNVATIWNIQKMQSTQKTKRHKWSAIYFLILHLSIADLLVTIFCIFGEAAWSYTVAWIAGELSCKLVKFFQMFSLYLSTYVLVLIGVDRWVAVKYPMKSLNMARRCVRLLISMYFLSTILSIPQVSSKELVLVNVTRSGLSLSLPLQTNHFNVKERSLKGVRAKICNSTKFNGMETQYC